jgi:hypothetical protein
LSEKGKIHPHADKKERNFPKEKKERTNFPICVTWDARRAQTSLFRHSLFTQHSVSCVPIQHTWTQTTQHNIAQHNTTQHNTTQQHNSNAEWNIHPHNTNTDTSARTYGHSGPYKAVIAILHGRVREQRSPQGSETTKGVKKKKKRMWTQSHDASRCEVC